MTDQNPIKPGQSSISRRVTFAFLREVPRIPLRFSRFRVDTLLDLQIFLHIARFLLRRHAFREQCRERWEILHRWPFLECQQAVKQNHNGSVLRASE